MAHIAKYKASAVGKLCAHYNRWQGIDNPNVSRENIDKSRTHLNYTLGVYEKDGKRFIGKVRGSASWATVKGRIDAVNARAKAEGKRATRKDAVVMADMVVTLPPNVPPEDAYKFFWNSYQYIADRVGRGNLMGGYVHMDETTPHMHVPFTPILDGRFNYKKMCDRKFYQTFHKGLGDRLEQKMGYRPEVELSEETRAQRVYTSRTKDIDKVRGAVDKAVVEPAQQEAERIVAAAKEEAAALLNDAELRKAELVTEIADKEGDLAELDSQLEDVKLDIEDEQDRLECLRQRADGVARDVEELRPIAAEVRGWEAAGKAERGAILDSIAARCAGAARAARAAIEELGDRIWALMRPKKTQRTERNLDDVMREATEVARAAKALSRNHVAPTNSRSRGQAR
ncbi:plasmid recombination protein [Collinsella aerofaciens]|uniref:plasmid recombination protein n=1 Tax=Collinsella aerofaciens TaxID=74426 RepID=UPI00232AE312|nr:plasmid recombination protein [Collinsella aerofaciens]MDB1917027.1 plasmid recombination protein [Collinsella aerofaciens]